MDLRLLRYFVVVAEGQSKLKTIQECPRAVLWNGTCALAPPNQPLPAGLMVVADRPPSELVVAWREPSPLVRSFVAGVVA